MSVATSPALVLAPPLPSRRRQDWLSPEVVLGLVRAADLALIGLMGLAAYRTFAAAWAVPPLLWFAIACTVLLAGKLLAAAGAYRWTELGSLREQAKHLLPAWSGSLLLVLGLDLLTASADELPPRLVLVWWAYGLAAMLLLRLLVRRCVQVWQEAGRLLRNIVIVGAGPHAARLIQHVHRSAPEARIIGIFDDRRTRIPHYIGGFPVLGTVNDLLAFARTRPIDQVIVALPWEAEGRILEYLRKLRPLPVDVRLCPDLIGFHFGHRGVTDLAGVPLLNVHDKPLAGWSYVLKSLEDRLLAGLVLLLIAPAMLLVALLVKLSSPGPVFYRQQRYGFNNEVIEVFKFRSMYVDQCDRGQGTVAQATRDDPRVTPIGRILRKTSLDELPQFLNVLKGDMSIVGPRPHAVSHNEHYAGLIDDYLARHRVKPGITGWAQVNGLRGETSTLEKMQERIRYDLHYIENWSLLLDLRIIVRTLVVGFSHPNAY